MAAKTRAMKNTTYSLVATLAQRFLTPKERTRDFDNTVALAVVPSAWAGVAHRKHKRISYILSMSVSGNEDRGGLFPRLLQPDQLDYTLIMGWLEFCKENHNLLCSDQNTKGLGLKVIDCWNRKIVLANADCKHIALSYVWGRQALEPQPVDGLLPKRSALCIEDAIIVARSLGIRYLWVDRYCIDQNNAQEKHNLISRMDQVYRSAWLTIVAAAGDNSSFGLPGVSVTPRVPQPVVRVGQRLLVSTLQDPTVEFENSKYATRGWTYQEALLSCRRLVFTNNQIYFQCLGMHCFESMAAQTKSGYEGSIGEQFGDAVAWRRIFPIGGIGTLHDFTHRKTEFMRRELSYESDALNAFLGIIHAFMRKQPGSFHFWGVPSWSLLGPTSRLRSPIEILLSNLCWNTTSRKTRLRKCTGFPSWSALSWTGLSHDGRINYPTSDGFNCSGLDGVDPTVQVEDIETSRLVEWDHYASIDCTASPYLQYASYLYIETWSIKLLFRKVHKMSKANSFNEIWEVGGHPALNSERQSLFLNENILKEAGSENELDQRFWDCIVLGSIGDSYPAARFRFYFLIIEPISTDVGFIYQRIGLLVMTESYPKWKIAFERRGPNTGSIGGAKFTRRKFKLG